MAVKLLEEGGIANSPNQVYVVDNDDDMDTIVALFGTLVLNLEDGCIYCMSSTGEWKKINN